MTSSLSPERFRELIDALFTMLSEDPEMGPRLRAADTPQRFEFEDLDLVVNIRAAPAGDPRNLDWIWSDEIDWTPKVQLTMSAQTANRFFQGRENVALALARRRIRAGGDLGAALELAPIIKPVHERYRALVQHRYPDLVA